MSKIPISELPEITDINTNAFLAVDDGAASNKITVENFNKTASASAKQYADEAAASAQAAAASASGASDTANTVTQTAQNVTQIAQTASNYASAAESSAASANTSMTTALNAASNASTYAREAENAADGVEDYAALSKSWAVGGTGKRDGEDVNNAMYWSNVAQSVAGGGVASFNGRGGAVVPQTGDYDAQQITYNESTVKAGIDNAQTAADNAQTAADNAQTAADRKQDILTDSNAGSNISITDEDGTKKINCTLVAGGSTIRITTDDPSLNGRTVTVTDGNETMQGVFVDGKCDISGVIMSGTLQVSATNADGDEAKGTVEVSNYASYSVNIHTWYIFAIHYTENNGGDTTVEYPEGYDNSDYTPMTMNLSTGVPNYGSWDYRDEKNAWMFPKSAMVTYDDKIDYYLDENDETKKEDGTASDVANTAYEGNAMMVYGHAGKIYWKIVPDADKKGFTFIWANKQVDPDMKAWNFIDANGDEADYFGVAKYQGVYVGTRLRSISSGSAIMVNTTRQQEIDRAKANNTDGDEEWYIKKYVDWLYETMILYALGKSTNTQAVFGQGRVASNNTAGVAGNTLNGKGLFCGYSNQTSDVKVLGHHGWGNIWDSMAGLINDKGTVKIKLTYGKEDGSTVDGFNLDGTGYIPHGTMSGTSGGYTSHMEISEKGFTPSVISGSASTYYCDGVWFNNGQVNYVLAGGNWLAAALCGAACVALSSAASRADANIGASLSWHPLAGKG